MFLVGLQQVDLVVIHNNTESLMPQLSSPSPRAAGGVLWLFQVTFHHLTSCCCLIMTHEQIPICSHAHPYWILPCSSHLHRAAPAGQPRAETVPLQFMSRIGAWNFPKCRVKDRLRDPLYTILKKNVKGNEIWARAFRDSLTSQLPC